jgi:hypothetical protein
MAKRLTDSDKWRNPWFRKLPSNAKLAWMLMCDECDTAGIYRPDYELMEFLLGFRVDRSVLEIWFESRLHFFQDKILLVDFFNFQYEKVKDSWSAKIKAIQILESYGFTIENNNILIDRPTVVPQYPHSGGSVLINIKDNIDYKIKNKDEDFEQNQSKISEAWKAWIETLKHFGIPQSKILPTHETSIARAIKTIGFQNVMDAIEGQRYEQATENFNPKNYLRLDRVLHKDKNGVSRFESLANLARMHREKKIQETSNAEKLRDIALNGRQS